MAQGQKENTKDHQMACTTGLMYSYSLSFGLTRHHNLACKLLKEEELARQSH